MLLRGMAIVAALISGAAFTLHLTNGEAAIPEANGLVPAHKGVHTMGMAPLSIGNPATAYALASLSTNRSFATGSSPTQGGRDVTMPSVRFKLPYTVKKGDTLARILRRAKLPPQTTSQVIRALNGTYNPRDLRIGQVINIEFIKTPSALGAADRFTRLIIPLDYARRVQVSPAPQGGFKAFEIERNLQTQTVFGEGTIDWSLFAAGAKAGVATPVMAQLVRAFSWDVDFQRDIRANDHFAVLYERKLDEAGKVVHNGRILYAALTLSGQVKPIFLYKSRNGTTDYFDDKGQSAKKALMRTPIDGARLSSSFGRRRHPVLGYTKMHKGTDFAAPRGTPIYAAGDGIIEKSGRNGSYGNYMRIRHNSEYSTAYAHMKSIKRGRTKGSRVRQGQVIGYVGTTGRSTGPHLHYEILRNGRQTNPMRVKMPSGKKLSGQDLVQFKTKRDSVQAILVTLKNTGSRIAKR